MTKEFLFLSGRISALASKLLTEAQLDRMVMADSPEAAFRVLVELQYASQFNDDTEAKDFLKIINQGLLETKKMILEGTDNDESFEFIWKNFDLNNIKRALKIKLLEGGTEIIDFSEDNGFNGLGSLTVDDIHEIVFSAKEESLKKIPREYHEALLKAEEVFKETGDFQLIELMLDRAHFEFLHRIAQGKGVPFLQEWLSRMADATNIKTVARNLLIFESKFSREMFLPYGKIAYKDLAKVDSIESAEELFKKYELFYLEGVLKENKSAEENIIALERALAKEEDYFLTMAEADALGEIQIPLVYLHRRIKNARKIKYVMLSKFYGMEPELIYETLKHI